MAEVYEARRPGPRGFAKRVALKRILPQLAMDQRLVRMFCAEARVHAALAHPNLVSVLDFGEADGELYLVMEYVDGVPLSEVLRAVVARKRCIELGPALHIAREVAAGLAYAHQYRDDDDAPLGVVHRDVAPNNILLGRAGEVKLTDFGIVHSTWSDVRTAPGELRGKVGYVSPSRRRAKASKHGRICSRWVWCWPKCCWARRSFRAIASSRSSRTCRAAAGRAWRGSSRKCRPR